MMADKSRDMRLPAAVAAVLALVLFFFGSSRTPDWEELTPVKPSASASVAAQPAPAPSASASPAVLFAPASAGISVPTYSPPSLEEVEANLKLAYGHRITSKAILHVMAVDWMQPSYKAVIAEAKVLADRDEYDQAIRLLENELGKTDPEHLTARISLLRAEEEIMRKGKLFDRIDEVSAKLEELRQQVLTMVMKAAKEGGIPQSEVKDIMDKMENRRKQNEITRRGADWLSGRKLADDEEMIEDETTAKLKKSGALKEAPIPADE
jgi:hypothetical protein